MKIKRIFVMLCCLFVVTSCGNTKTEKAAAPSYETAASKDKSAKSKSDDAMKKKNSTDHQTSNTPQKSPLHSPTAEQGKDSSSCSSDSPEQAIKAVEKYTKVYGSKDIFYYADKREANTYNVYAKSKDMIKQGGSGTIGNYLVDTCSGDIWNISDLIPDEMIGTWIGVASNNKKIKYIITNRTIQTDGKTYIIDVCNPDFGNLNITYTISWKLDDFKKQYGYTPVGPQPFILTYNKQNDTITIAGGAVLKKAST